jgi:hypothetical protein
VDRTKSTGLRLYSNQLKRYGTSGSYINAREVTKRFRLVPGNYVIIPSTYDSDISCEFIIRIFTEHKCEASDLNEHKDALDEEESFFELEDTDKLFNSWSSLFGIEDNDDTTVDDNNNLHSQQQDDDVDNFKPYHQGPKEKCNIM